MSKQYHILNGDHLKNQFPSSIVGELIVARECLVDGNVNGSSLSELFNTRAMFISTTYDGCTVEEYFEKTVTEFLKMNEIESNSEINLWFEDDLFCQVNFWFVINLLSKIKEDATLFLVRPTEHDEFGFGGFNQNELVNLYKNRQELTEVSQLSQLWEAYQMEDLDGLTGIANALESLYPFLKPAVKAHIQRIPNSGFKGKPTESIIKIMTDLDTQDFGKVFQEFSKRESIYGFGDLQVKRLFNRVLMSRK